MSAQHELAYPDTSTEFAAEEILEVANVYWEMLYTEEPYSNLATIDYLRNQANIANWIDLLKLGYRSAQGLVALLQLDDKREAMTNDTNLTKALRGDSNALVSRMAEILRYHTEGRCDFQFYGIGGPSCVARCKKTGLFIDAFSLNGVFLLPEGSWFSRKSTSGAKWKYVGGVDGFVSNELAGEGLADSKRYSSIQEALVTSLFRVPQARGVSTWFRCVPIRRIRSIFNFSTIELIFLRRVFQCNRESSYGAATFSQPYSSIDPSTKRPFVHGLVTWRWFLKRLELSPAPTEANEHYIIQFGEGTVDTHNYCFKMLAAFIDKFGGPYGCAQWNVVEPIHIQIWEAATEVWGKSRWSIVEALD